MLNLCWSCHPSYVEYDLEAFWKKVEFFQNQQMLQQEKAPDCGPSLAESPELLDNKREDYNISLI